MRAFRTAAPPLCALQQLKSAEPCRASVHFKSQLYTTNTQISIHKHNVYPRTFSTTRPSFQSLSPQPTNIPPASAVEIIPGKLAGPKTSLPGDLEIPERVKDDSTIGYYFKVGKGYVRFTLPRFARFRFRIGRRRCDEHTRYRGWALTFSPLFMGKM